MLALQIVSATTCRCSFQRLAPRGKAAADGPAALAAYDTPTLLSPYVVGESRDCLNDLRAKCLR